MDNLNIVKEQCFKVITDKNKNLPELFAYTPEVRVEAMKAYALLCELERNIKNG